MSRAVDDHALDRLRILDDRGGRRYVLPADARGRLQSARQGVFAALLLVYVGAPWVRLHGAPLLLLDVPRRRFNLLGAVFNAQDVGFAFFGVTGVAFLLLLASALWGRVWCGWACPQTVFLEGIYRRIERAIEGNRNARAALARSPWSLGKLAKRSAKHGLYVVVSLLLAHTLLAYFIPAEELVDALVADSPLSHWTTFLWGAVVTGLLYFNFFWFREQTCTILCPYGRLQSVLQDADTVVIGYDGERGDPRGKPGKVAGDCADCHRCVTVCPTGIDIRDGLQMECIGCAACVDACDDVMAKLHRKKGLIRYDSLRGFAGEARRLLRPRVVAYAAAGLLGLVVALVAASTREPFEAHVLRIAGVPFFVDEHGVLRNQLMIHVVNKRDLPTTFHVVAGPTAGVDVLLPQPAVDLAGHGGRQVPVLIAMPRAARRGDEVVILTVRDLVTGAEEVLRVPVLGPRP